MTPIIYFCSYLFETFSHVLFFDNFYYRKKPGWVRFIVYAVTFAFQYGISFFENRWLNLSAFILSVFLTAYICYLGSFKAYAYTTALLTFFMFFFEVGALSFLSWVFNVNLKAYQDNMLILTTGAVLSKLSYFVITYFIARYYKHKENSEITNQYIALLAVLPLTTLLIFCIIFYYGIKTNDTSNFNGVLAICSVLLLFANIFVFYIYEKVQSTNYEITQLKLQQQKGEISTEYYKLLSDEYNKQRIVIHDIKNHFQSIDVLAQKGDTEKLKRYIGNLTREMGINTNMVYTGNEMIDVIINRYRYAAWERGISFETESISSGLAFMEDNDVVAMLDNLLDNAIESAEKSQGKKITLEIFVRNGGFVTVNVTNSCDRKPTLKDGILATIKQNTENHGIGTKSIKRTAKKYGGNFKWNYDSQKKLFCVSVVMSGENV